MSEADGFGSVRPEFLGRLGFIPDQFQVDAFDALDDGHNVIVAAPTGAGKTLVADYAVAQSLGSGRRLFYTTPIKALSNQKYHDFVNEYGAENVGLLTGDNTVNGDAAVVVMTTEVLRNMLYAGNTLDRLQTVVLDEVHYLQDAYRGPVWEEVIIHLPRSISLLCLSATVSNADELADWISAVRGPTSLVLEQRRPVDLTTFYMTAERRGSHVHTLRVLQGTKPNPKAFRFDHDPRRRVPRQGGAGKQRRPQSSFRTPRRAEVVRQLDKHDQLPVIFFIFSRAGCDEAARSVVDAGVSFTTKADRKRIRTIVNDHIDTLSDDDLEVLDYESFLAGLEAGVAAHHAGMVPPLKEAVEACFVAGLVKVVFATETLALGINMPARSVVLEKLTKFTGEHHEFLSPAQFTQLTGRAGRRGIDTHGNAFVLWSPFVQFEQIAGLVSSKKFVLTSAFRPTYNMAANLVRRYESERARQLLNQSFAQFRADANVVNAERRIESLVERKKRLIGELEADYGPIADLRAAAATEPEDDKDTEAIAFALGHLVPGEIIECVGSEIPRYVVVISVSFRKKGRVRVKAVDEAGESYEITAASLEKAPTVVGGVELPQPYLPNSMTFLHQVGASLARARLVGAKKRRKLAGTSSPTNREDLPVAAVKRLKRLDKVERDLGKLQRSSRQRADSLGAQFDRVIDLLSDRGHLNGWDLTDSGQRLARLYHESDLLLVEALEAGLFDELGPPDVAALASVFVYEERRSQGGRLDVWYPSTELRRRFRQIQALHLDLVSDESDQHLPATKAPDAGFMGVAYGWASGGDLSDVLDGEELTAGDFVRTAKQLIDLLRQFGTIAEQPSTASAARSAADRVYRDLVAASSLINEGEGDGDDEGGDGATAPKSAT